MAMSISCKEQADFFNVLRNRPCVRVHVVQNTDISASAPQRELHLVPFTSRLARVSITVCMDGHIQRAFVGKDQFKESRPGGYSTYFTVYMSTYQTMCSDHLQPPLALVKIN